MKPFLVLLASLLPFAALHAAEPPLNVLLITADDLGYEAMDFLDGKVIRPVNFAPRLNDVDRAKPAAKLARTRETLAL